jgi:hypothetical protein
VRLRELLRERIMSLLPRGEIELHAQRVATKSEDPYTAVEAVVQKVTSA